MLCSKKSIKNISSKQIIYKEKKNKKRTYFVVSKVQVFIKFLDIMAQRKGFIFLILFIMFFFLNNEIYISKSLPIMFSFYSCD